MMDDQTLVSLAILAVLLAVALTYAACRALGIGRTHGASLGWALLVVVAFLAFHSMMEADAKSLCATDATAYDGC